MDRQDTGSTHAPDFSPVSGKSSYKTNSEIVSLREQINLISKMLYLSGEREKSYQDQINNLNRKLDILTADTSSHNYQLSCNIYLMECRLRSLYNDYRYIYEACMRQQRDMQKMYMCSIEIEIYKGMLKQLVSNNALTPFLLIRWDQ